MATKTLIQEISATIGAIKYCVKNKYFGANFDHLRYLKALEKLLPHGSGFDSGTKILVESSCSDVIILATEFHHMNDTGYYDGWTSHNVRVTPTFQGIDLIVSGVDKNEIREYIAEVFQDVLTQEYKPED